jgi:uncharacterized protein (TIGR01777 family)
MKKVLITGGTGMVGQALSAKLHALGFEVRILSRKKFQNAKYKSFSWIPEENYIDEAAFNELDYIVHLAGENLGAKRWSKKQKKKIYNSRVNTAELLFEKVKSQKINLKAFVSASAVGIYPTFSHGEEYYIEKDMYGTGFTAQVCIAWEKAADNFKTLGVRTVKIRTGLVQDKKDPALAKILMMSKFGIIPVFGRGKQYYPWIHIDDLVNIYVAAIENENFEDPFNAVAPDFVTNEQYTRTLKSVLGKKIIMHIPAFVIKLMFGEMSEIILRGTKIHSKLHSNNFEFKYPELKMALGSLVK